MADLNDATRRELTGAVRGEGMSPAQRRVLLKMLDGMPLMQCKHVRLEDGVSHWLGQDINARVHPATVYVLIRKKWITATRDSVGGATFVLSSAGRNALSRQDRETP